ncbi:hypothetical protein ACVI1N_000380 [Sinorhizobium medicae]
MPLSKTGAELLFELISQRYERGATLITSNLPFDEWTETLGSERLTGALLDRITHHVNILEMTATAIVSLKAAPARLAETPLQKASRAHETPLGLRPPRGSHARATVADFCSAPCLFLLRR